MSIKKMVVAYDGSEGSQKALAWAVDLALQLKSDVTVITVVKPPEFSSNIDEVDEFYAAGEKHCRPLLEKAVAFGEEHGLTIQTEILHGHPAESIVRYAVNRKADLIVMGTRGLGGFKNLVIGSVAQKVMTYSKVPVTIMK